METQAGLQSHMHTYCTAGHYLQSIGRRVLKHILAVVKTTSLLSMSHVARARGVSLVVPQLSEPMDSASSDLFLSCQTFFIHALYHLKFDIMV